jgi:hypothetical protein
MTKNLGGFYSLVSGQPFLGRATLLHSLAFLFLAAAPVEAGLVFDVDYSPGVLMSPKAAGIMAGVAAATSTWSSIFHDSITVTVKVEMDSEAMDVDLGTSPFTFAAAINSYEMQPYSSVKAAMIGDAKSPEDAAAVGLLQPGPYLEALTHDTSLSPLDLGPGVPSPEIRIGSSAVGITGPKAEATWNSVLKVTRANSKALGLPVTSDGEHDIRLVLNDESVPVYDVDRSDGIGPMKFDFQAIATHEIGHGMGFLSGVDDVDYAGIGGAPPMAAPDNPLDLSDEAIFSVLDLFRTSPATRPPGIDPPQPATGFVLDWRFGPPSGFFGPSPFFSLDPSAIDPAMKLPFATGAENGDGYQASHWAVLPGPIPPIGLMTADLSPATILDVSGADVLAFDAIGWDLVAAVPEPSGCVLLAIGMLVAGLKRPRNRSLGI